MADAFKCDECGEYADGEPAEKLYRKQSREKRGKRHVLRAELCESCSEGFAGGPPDEEVSADA